MNEQRVTESAEDERVGALTPAQLGALAALVVAIILLSRPPRRN